MLRAFFASCWRAPGNATRFALVVAALASAAACSFLITDNVPPFNCAPDQKDVCPNQGVCLRVGNANQCMARCTAGNCATGFECDPTSNACVPVTDASFSDDSPDDDLSPGEPNADAGDGSRPDADATVTANGAAGDDGGDGGPCSVGAIGCPCNPSATAAACEVGAFCADWSQVSGTFDGGQQGVCTKACCSSSDCDKGTVCYATATGGNYCVPASSLQRATKGPLNLNAGQPCDGGGVCRSGVCAAGMNICADTCCSGSSPGPPGRQGQGQQGQPQCFQGTSCRLGTFQGVAPDTNYVPRCAPPTGTNGNGEPCTANSVCRSNLCLTDPFPVGQNVTTCRDPCRRPEDCGGMGGMGAIGGAQTCQYLALPPAAGSASSTDLVAACVPLTPSGPGGIGDAGAGAPCKNSSECARGYCALTDRGSVCLAVCFVDGDCISNEMCRPQALAVGETVFSVLACR